MAIGVRSSHSEGLLKAVGGYSYVWNSKAYSPGLLQITGGHTKVIGAANTGRLEVSTTGTVKVADTTNSGSVKVTVSNDVFLSGITNKAGGTVSVTNVNASLYNIENAGDVTMSGGTGYAYGIKNSGKITVKTGSTLTLELVGAQCGTVTFEAGSKGTVTAPTGCKITKPDSGVTVKFVTSAPTSAPTSASIAKKVTTVKQDVTFKNLAAADYKGDVQKTYELAYGKANGLTTTTGTIAFLTGASVASSASRRTAKVTFVATMQPTFKGTKPTSATTASAASIATAVSTVVTNNNVTGVTAPKAADLTVATATVGNSVVSTSTSSSSNNFMIWIVVIIGVVVVVAAIIAVTICYVSGACSSGGHSTVLVKQGELGVEMGQPGVEISTSKSP